jgi:hypothetical protein
MSCKATYIELTHSHDLYSHLFDFAPVGYFVLSDKGIITVSNMTATKLFRIDKSKLYLTRSRLRISKQLEFWI